MEEQPLTKRPEPPKSPVTAPADLCRIFTDRPVATAEGLAFEFGGLAMTLAELAWNGANATPFTAVVRGGWGRGKTTLLRQTQRLLDEQADADDGRRQVRTVWFNAWKYPSDDTVLGGLLGALLDVYLRPDPRPPASRPGCWGLRAGGGGLLCCRGRRPFAGCA